MGNFSYWFGVAVGIGATLVMLGVINELKR